MRLADGGDPGLVVDLAAIGLLAGGAAGGGVLGVLAAAGDDDAHGRPTLGRCAPVRPGLGEHSWVAQFQVACEAAGSGGDLGGCAVGLSRAEGGDDASVVPFGAALLDGGGDGDGLRAGHHRKVTTKRMKRGSQDRSHDGQSHPAV